jgi:hypothetical protein
MRRVNRLVLAAQTRRDLRGQTAQHLIGSIYQQPAVLDLLCFGGKCFHNHNS